VLATGGGACKHGGMAEVGRGGPPTSARRGPDTDDGLRGASGQSASEIELVSTRDFKAAPHPGKRRHWWHVPRFLRRGLVVIIFLLIVEYLVIPELLLAKKSIHALEHVNIALLLLGLGLEVLAQLAYAKLTLVLLPPDSLSLSKGFRINVAALGVSHVLPGGTAGGTGLGYRLMTTNGVKGTDVAFAAASQGIGSAVVLNAMLWLALVVSIPINGFRPVYVTVAIISAVLLALFAALVVGFAEGRGWAANALRYLARRVRFIREDRMENAVRHIAYRLHSLGDNRALLTKGVVWAASNWLLDATCLWVCLAAFNYALNPIDLFVAYGVGNVLAAIPLTPGGLGPVEAAVPAVLRGFGVPIGIGALAVLGWRLFSFWLPIPAGAGCWVSLRVGRGASWPERRAALGSLTAEARGASASRETEVGRADDEATPPATVEEAAEPAPRLVRHPRWLARLDRWGWFAERR
jgi:uncharacterized protein (TIRG00374 family)